MSMTKKSTNSFYLYFYGVICVILSIALLCSMLTAANAYDVWDNLQNTENIREIYGPDGSWMGWIDREPNRGWDIIYNPEGQVGGFIQKPIEIDIYKYFY